MFSPVAALVGHARVDIFSGLEWRELRKSRVFRKWPRENSGGIGKRTNGQAQILDSIHNRSTSRAGLIVLRFHLKRHLVESARLGQPTETWSS